MTTEERLIHEVKISNLRSRVTIWIPKSTIDAYGNETISYKKGNTVWAYVENHATQMYESPSEAHITRKVLIVMRYRPDLKPESRFEVGGSFFKTLGTPIDALGKHHWTYVECVSEDKNL